LAAVMRPALTTCRVHRELMGALSVQRLIERATEPAAPPLALVLDAPLIERQSTRAVGKEGCGTVRATPRTVPQIVEIDCHEAS
jgi:hypothetical protein